MFARLFQYCL